MQIYIFKRFVCELFVVYIYNVISDPLKSHFCAAFIRCILLILAFPGIGTESFLQAQHTLRFERIGRNEGLSQSSVNCMLRDKEGFMWFGTQDGLNLFDGKKFRVFQNQPGDSTSLSNNYIVSITEDEEGALWVGTMTGGLNRFDKRTERFRAFLHSEQLNSISENTVWTVLSDGEGNIWSGTSKGLNKLNIKNKRFRTYRPVPNDTTSLVTDMVVSLFKDKRGRIWVGTVEGLCMINRARDSFIRFNNPFENELKGANLIWSISETPEGDIITGTNNGVYLLDVNTGNYQRILGSPDESQLVAWSVNALQKGYIWTGSDRGLFRIQIPGNKVQSFLNNAANPGSLSNNNVWCLLTDPSGFLWTGTNDGICKTKTTEPLFHLLSDKPGSPLRLSSSRIMAVLEDKKGNLWIGTDGGGLNCVSPDRKSVKVYNTSNSGLINDNIWSLAADKKGNIYIGNYQGGLHCWDARTDKIQAFPFNRNDEHSLSNPRVLALLVARDGSVWIGTRGGGLNRYFPETGHFKVYQHAPDDPYGFPSNTVLSLAEDPRGQIWVGTHEGGLAMFIPAKETFRVFRQNPSEPGSLSDNNIWALELDSKGRLWIGTQGGLNVCDQPLEKQVFRYFTTRNGLKSNMVLGLNEDSEGNLWISSFSGLAKLDIRTYEKLGNQENEDDSYSLFHPLFCLFDTDHGLQGLEFNQGCSYKGKNGMLYFGGNNGLNYFSDKEVKPSNYCPPVVLTGFRVFNKEVTLNPGIPDRTGLVPLLETDNHNYQLPLKITYIKELRLSYRESVISFEFSSLDYSNPGKNLYAYKMVNFDDEWNYVGTQNTATYTNLDPGEYTLLIRGSNSDGIWNPKETAIRIIITPPFWKTIWFILLASFLILLLIFLFIRQLFRNQRIKAQREKEMIELQLKTIKSQIDPHFAFNAINTIAGFIYSEKPDITYDYFTRFAKMIRNILEDNEKISRSLSEELDFVKNYLELQKMRFRDKFDYTIVTGDEVSHEIPVPKMIIQSYAENAIKHGLMHRKSGGILTISIRKTTSELLVSIEDNGVGREKAAQLTPDSTRRGFRIMEQIIDLYRKLYRTNISQHIEDLSDEEGNPSGTRVILTIQLPEK